MFSFGHLLSAIVGASIAAIANYYFNTKHHEAKVRSERSEIAASYIALMCKILGAKSYVKDALNITNNKMKSIENDIQSRVSNSGDTEINEWYYLYVSFAEFMKSNSPEIKIEKEKSAALMARELKNMEGYIQDYIKEYKLPYDIW
ncbi:hypothetical protein [Magnetofaba australis]|uniref:Uncharacterized protein n=1 Tax=Magnetofaba australis IT-1 TaxID=1434232 RepID=A0A1Y2K1U7_9PROT|nr:hypothetical protein [Magnetofaba australis]OSM01637.1 hypothetical protein MAIT1_05329 [Magnetofaba australis IT-1]